MTSLTPLGGAPSPHPALEAFRESASHGAAVRVSVDGEDFQVLAEGRFDAGGATRSVVWVEDSTDTTRMFLDAMSQSFGSRISSEVTRELGLAPAPGKPLASRLVNEALDMAQTGQQALSGVDFVTRLEHSAVLGGAAFHRIAVAAGIDPKSLSADTLAMLDRQLQDRFDAAVVAGATPVSPDVASQWVTTHLASLASSSP